LSGDVTQRTFPQELPMARLTQGSSESDSSQKLTLDLDVHLKGNGLTIPLAKIGAVIAAVIGTAAVVIGAILRFH
jgi:hypothetical protein